MDEVQTKIEALRKAIKEAGLVFHSPHSPTVVADVRAPQRNAFAGETTKANDQQMGDYHALPHQKELLNHLEKVKYKPDAGKTLQEYSGHQGGLHTQGKNSFVQDYATEKAPRTIMSKRGQGLTPDERMSWSIDDRKMSIPQREVAYHNIAHHFGVGEHLPGIVLHNDDKGDQWSVQDFHHDHEIGDGKQRMVRQLKGLHDAGHFPKIAVMDNILGNTDRHMGNVLFGKKDDSVKFIDNGMSFVSNGQSPVPAYYTHKDYAHLFNGKITPEFKGWVKGIAPEKLKHLMDIHGVPADAQDMAMKRLEQAHKAIDKSTDHNQFFNQLKRSIF